MKKGDIFIIVGIVFIMALLGIGYKLYVNNLGTDRYVEIKIDGQIYKTVQLTNTTDVEVPIQNQYGYNLVHIYNMGFEVVEADCKNQVDVKHGFESRPGMSVICVPHHLEIMIVGQVSDPLDGVAQ